MIKFYIVKIDSTIRKYNVILFNFFPWFIFNLNSNKFSTFLKLNKIKIKKSKMYHALNRINKKINADQNR
jgi:hypothetical protein